MATAESQGERVRARIAARLAELDTLEADAAALSRALDAERCT